MQEHLGVSRVVVENDPTPSVGPQHLDKLRQLRKSLDLSWLVQPSAAPLAYRFMAEVCHYLLEGGALSHLRDFFSSQSGAIRLAALS